MLEGIMLRLPAMPPKPWRSCIRCSGCWRRVTNRSRLPDQRRSCKRSSMIFEPGWETNTEKLGYRLQSHLAFADIQPDRYDGLVIPGGRAPDTFDMKHC